MKRTCLICFLFFYTCISCKKNASTSSIKTDTTVINPNFIKGADMSWLTQMESDNIKFHDSTGTQRDCMQILKNLGMNALRLRAWVNPTDGWCNTTDVLNKALRAKSLGLKIMIDIHYSDVWADPGHQTKPAAWNALTLSALDSAVYNYTFLLMDTLRKNGISPDWAQVGNETNDGMLWEDGRASTNMQNFALLVNSGYSAIKAVSDSTKVIVHISNGFDNSLFEWMFDGLKANNAKWDIIGMSLYPSYSSGGAASWMSVNAACLANMNDMVSRYGKPVMIVEAGMPVGDPATCRSFLADIIAKTRAVPKNMGLGVLYWEPECFTNWNGYSLGAFDNTGRPTIALDAFLN
jgi:arabinogalactan endo-1,4-beta-galactosidase